MSLDTYDGEGFLDYRRVRRCTSLGCLDCRAHESSVTTPPVVREPLGSRAATLPYS